MSPAEKPPAAFVGLRLLGARTGIPTSEVGTKRAHSNL